MYFAFAINAFHMQNALYLVSEGYCILLHVYMYSTFVVCTNSSIFESNIPAPRIYVVLIG